MISKQLQQIHDEWLKDVMSREPNHSYEYLFSQLPRIEDLGADPTVQCKFFMPATGWRWYVLSGLPLNDGNWILHCYTTSSDYCEFGDVSLRELQSAVGPLGACVERDQYFTPVPVSKIISGDEY